jgi:hypothetical protein
MTGIPINPLIQNRNLQRQPTATQQITKQPNESGTTRATGHLATFHIVLKTVKLDWEEFHPRSRLIDHG